MKMIKQGRLDKLGM